MAIEQGPRDPRTARDFSLLVQALRNPFAPAACASIAGAMMGGLYDSLYSRESDLYPASFYARGEGTWIAVLDGASRQSHIQNLFNGYNNGGLFERNQPVNQYLKDWGYYAVNKMRERGWTYPTHVWMVGWSTGGAAAEYMPEALEGLQFLTAQKHVCTFGAPKMAGVELCARTSDLYNVARWMTVRDLVPYLPYTLRQNPLLALNLNPSQIVRLDSFTHPVPGWEVNEHGVITRVLYPSGAATRINLASSVLLGAGGTQERYDHDITTYTAYLTASIPVSNPIPRPEVPRIPTPEITPRSVIAQERTQVQTSIFAQEHRQNQVPVVIPRVRLAYKYRQGRTWFVAFNQVTFGSTGSKKKASQVVRRVNDFLRSIQDQALIDPSALSLQFQDYFTAASDPAGGFAPVMATTISL